MKNFILAILLGIILVPFSVAEDDLYPLDIQMQAIPEKIHYGDVCFLVFSVTNNGPETLLLPYGNNFLHTMGGVLYREQKGLYYDIFNGPKIFQHFGSFDVREEDSTVSECTYYSYPGRPVKPGETMVFHIKPVRIPRLPSTGRDDAVELRKFLKSASMTRGETFQLRFYFNYYEEYVSTGHPRFDVKGLPLNENEIVREGLTAKELAKKRPEYPYEAYFPQEGKPPRYLTSPYVECSIQILPRFQEEIDLLQALHLDYSSNVAAQISMTLGRSKQANDLASQIIEWSKQPDSTISQNMVEFIQLRGFLVDMRYAEDEQAEQAAFEKLMNFVDTAGDRELWTRFLDEIGLYSIMHQTHFPSRKVEHYRELFTRRFNEVKNLGLIE